MKKIFSTLAVAAMMVVMASCGGKADKTSEAAKTPAEQAVAIVEEATAKLANATPEEADKIADEMRAKIYELLDANPDFRFTHEDSVKFDAAYEKYYNVALEKRRAAAMTLAEQAIDEATAKLANATPEEAYKIVEELVAKMGELEMANPDFKPSDEESAKIDKAMSAFQEAFNKVIY